MEAKITKARTEAMTEASKKFETEKKQLTTELFKLDSSRSEAEDRARTIMEADQEKAEEIRRIADQHRADLDKIRKEAQNTDSRHVSFNIGMLSMQPGVLSMLAPYHPPHHQDGPCGDKVGI